jgi:hypothetical protein
MNANGTAPLIIIGVFLIVFGTAVLGLASHIQRLGIALMGKPRGPLAAWSLRLAGSRTSLRSIRATGGMCIAVGAVLVAMLVMR